MALVGPNGSGKSTAVDLLAGLLRPYSGRAVVGDRVLFEVAAGRGPVLAPHRRRIALLAQATTLFGNLDVRDNVAFGPRRRGMDRRAARARAMDWLEAVGLAQVARAHARSLSGGQARRVALARALAADPELLLLDEPLAALDTAAAADMRHLLREHLAGRSCLLVTHDLLDVALLADQVAVLEGGRVVESGAAEQLLHRPQSPFAAELFGWNLLPGRACDPDKIRTDEGWVVAGVPESDWQLGGRAAAVFRPADVALHEQSPTGSPRNVWPMTVQRMEPLGPLVRIRGDAIAADVTPAAVAELGLQPGQQVYASVKAAAVALYRTR